MNVKCNKLKVCVQKFTLTVFRILISVLKKVKHRVVETMNTNTADALGLSRAILCNGRCTYTVKVVYFATEMVLRWSSFKTCAPQGKVNVTVALIV